MIKKLKELLKPDLLLEHIQEHTGITEFAKPRSLHGVELDAEDRETCYCEEGGKIHEAWEDAKWAVEERVVRYESKHCDFDGRIIN